MVMTMESRERLAGLINSVEIAADVPSKLQNLHQLKQNILQQDSDLLYELLPRVLELQSDRSSPIRKFVAEMIGETGFKHLYFLPQIVPVLITVLSDHTPAVARQAITCGIYLFRCCFEKIAIEGLHSTELDSALQSLWACMLNLKEKIYSIAFQGSGGMRLLALKFVVEIILLYTPDPNGSSEPPPHDGILPELNIAWLRAGHPLLNVGDLSIEASQNLSLLLDQLRFPNVESISNAMIIVLINSLSAITEKRPAFYGRILPVLLGLDPSSSIINVLHAPGVHRALKNAFLSCLKCTHPGATPWRDRLVGALREMKAGELAEQVHHQDFKVNGNLKEEQVDLLVPKDEKLTIKPCDAGQSYSAGKRSADQAIDNLAENDDDSRKRARATPSVSEESSKEVDRNIDMSQDDVSSSRPASSREEIDTGPVQQLVAMFGALVAQGEKAIGHLQILISSISADLLAEVVIANMRYIPPCRPDEGDGELLQNMSIIGGDAQLRYPSSFVANVLSLSTIFPPIASLLDASQSVCYDKKPQGEDQHEANSSPVCTGINQESENTVLSTDMDASHDIPSEMDQACLAVPFNLTIHCVENLENEIPGLESSACNDGLSESHVTSSLASTDFEDASQEQLAISSQRSPLNILPSVSTDRSEELSPRAAVTDVSSLVSSTETSMGLSFQFVLPKMSAPVVDLADDQKDNLQKSAFIRIVEAYKQIEVSGSSQVLFSLLAYLGVEYPLELDPWKLLQKHILADYINHEGHELTLRVLYRLFGEAEEESDFFSSTTAASVYETFLLTVAETLRDSFPPSDKSLSRLLGEVPFLPKSVVNLLEGMCCPGNNENAEKEILSGDRVTQGLSAVWSLILLRPPLRSVCLKIALQSAVHHTEEVRMKAIRLVANKLYPISSISQQIEEFSKEMLLSVTGDCATESTNAEVAARESEKESPLEKPSSDSMSVSAMDRDFSDTCQISESQRLTSLYFALCTKKHSLFGQVFIIYKNTSKLVKQVVHRHIPILVRTMGSSSDLLEIISDPPSGSENLLMQVLHTLTDGTIPSPELIFTIRKLFNSKLKDVEIMIPILPFLPKDEVLMVFPQIVNLMGEKFQAALARLLQGSSHSGPVLSPTEVLIGIHGIDPERDGIPLKKVTDACNACFEQRQIFTQQVLAKFLNQLVEHSPLPLLFMRTVLQAIGAFPALVDFIMEILSRLVVKQIWKYPKLWVGFLKCALLTKPQSFKVLLQLPPAQLENALNKTGALKAPLIAHASQPNVRSSLPRSTLTILGIDMVAPQTSSPAQASQTPTCTTNSDKEDVTDKAKESSTCSQLT